MDQNEERPDAVQGEGPLQSAPLGGEVQNDDSAAGRQEQRRSPAGGDRFPHQPGWRSGATGETSRAAALAVRPKAKPMMEVLTALLEQDGPASPEQLHAKLAEQGVSTLLTSVRARVCQLNKLGRVVDSGLRSLGESGRAKVIVWQLVPRSEWPTHEQEAGA